MKKFGLVLGGGGAKGSYQVGVLKALDEARMLRHVRFVSGTSIGAINAFLLMNKLKVSDISALWDNFTNENIRVKNDWKQFFQGNGYYSTDTMLELIKPYLKPEAFAKTKIQGYATVAIPKKKRVIRILKPENYDKEIIDLNKVEDPISYVLASAAIPLAFAKQHLGGNEYVDGGVIDNIPFEPLIRDEIDVILSIGLNSKEVQKEVLPNHFVIDFTPLEDLGNYIISSLDFAREKIERYYDQGYNDAKALIKHLKKEKYLRFFGRIKAKRGVVVSLNDLNLNKV